MENNALEYNENYSRFRQNLKIGSIVVLDHLVIAPGTQESSNYVQEFQLNHPVTKEAVLENSMKRLFNFLFFWICSLISLMLGWCSYVLTMVSTVDLLLLELFNLMVFFPVVFCTIKFLS